MEGNTMNNLTFFVQWMDQMADTSDAGDERASRMATLLVEFYTQARGVIFDDETDWADMVALCEEVVELESEVE
jgi:hypothetical protein